MDLLFPLHKETNTKHSTQLYTQVFHLISEHREVIYETREGVFHLLTKNPKSINPKSEKQYTKHEKSVSSDIFKTPRSIISNKRRSVSSAN